MSRDPSSNGARRAGNRPAPLQGYPPVQPRPREHVYRAYWELAAKRQRIFYSRLAGDPPPWTDDPVLGEYRFCNAYRASDRVSQYLIRHVIYVDGDLSPDDMLLRIVLFRLFSRPRTWQL